MKLFSKRQVIPNKYLQLEQEQILLGRYRLLQKIGGGGEAHIWKVFDQKLNQVFAAKFLLRFGKSSASQQRRLQQEARAYGRLGCPPGLVPVREIELNHGGKEGPFFLMDFLEGETLSAYLRKKSPLSLEECGKILQPLLQTVAQLHRQGVLHRDISAKNVFLEASKNGRVVRLLDLGCSFFPGETKEITKGTLPRCTVAYRPPEVREGFWGDSRSDLFSIGILLYEMAVGPLAREKFDVRNQLKPTLRPRVLHPECAESLEEVILRALSYEPSARYQCAEDFAHALADATGVTAPVPTEVRFPKDVSKESRPTPKTSQRLSKRKIAIGGLCLLVAFGFSVPFLWKEEAKQERPVLRQTEENVLKQPDRPRPEVIVPASPPSNVTPSQHKSSLAKEKASTEKVPPDKKRLSVPHKTKEASGLLEKRVETGHNVKESEDSGPAQDKFGNFHPVRVTVPAGQ